jgi:uncharacterized membrane protein (UPF0127 family)
MPVLVELLTLVVPRALVDERWPGAVDGLRSRVRPGSWCEDDDLVGFAVPDVDALRRALAALGRRGLRAYDGDEHRDVAVVGQHRGPLAWCRWLELANVRCGGGRVLAARFASSVSREVRTPAGWRWEGSASHAHGAGEPEWTDRPLDFVRRDPETAIYRDRFSGEEVSVRLGPRERLALGAHALTVDVVREPAPLSLGLMHRDRLDRDTGMLFDFGADAPRSFWMKNTRMALDLLFIDRDGRVVDLAEGALPMTTSRHETRVPCRMVLEVNAGWIARAGIRPGERLRRLGST